MSHQSPSARHTPLIDLATVRETISYIRDDLRRTPGFETAAAALSVALTDIEQAERQRQVVAATILRPRFLPWRKH